MDDSEATSLEQVRAFLAGSGEVRFAGQYRDGGIWMDGANADTASVRQLEPAGKGPVAPVCGAHDGIEPGAGDTPDRELCRDRPCEGGAVSTQKVRRSLHKGGRGTAGLCGQEPRQPERAGDEAHTGTRIRRIRQAAYQRVAGISVAQIYRFRSSESTASAIPAISRPGPRRSRSGSGANRGRRAGPGICASTRFIRATRTASKACITSTRSMK